MKVSDEFREQMLEAAGITRHPLCKITHNPHSGDYDCGYRSALVCESCKYGFGTKDPAAKCNQL
jgi:hypothetical protein